MAYHHHLWASFSNTQYIWPQLHFWHARCHANIFRPGFVHLFEVIAVTGKLYAQRVRKTGVNLLQPFITDREDVIIRSTARCFLAVADLKDLLLLFLHYLNETI